MKISIIFLALFYSVLGSMQEGEPQQYKVQKNTLCMGDVAKLGKKEIKFLEVVSDSRCPKEVSCIWAGEVKILVGFYEGGDLKGEKVISGSNISIGEFFDTEGLMINQIFVAPYPEIDKKILPEEYSVSLEIYEKLPGN